MKKFAKFIVAATLTATMVASVFSMAACTDGKDGATPEIKNGNWWVGDTDTGVKAEGTQGTQGEQGVGIKNISINAEGKLVITLSNDEVITLGKVTGADGVDGEDGQDGKGVKKFEINAEGKLVVTYSDDTTEVLDKVVGENGAAGNSIVGAEIDSDGNLILKMNEGGDITAGNVKGEQGVGIQSIEIKDGQFEITLTNGEVIHLDIPDFTSGKHTHSWNKSKEHEATCTSIGYIVYTCDVDECDSEKYEFTDAQGHNYKENPSYTIPATCIKEGLEIYNCEVCGDVKTVITEKTEHQYENGTCKVCGDVKPEGTEVAIAAGRTIGMPISDISEGVHIIEINLGSTKLTTGSIQAKIGDGALSDIVYSESRSTEDNNVYYGYLVVPAGATQVALSAIGEDVNGRAVIKDWEMPTLKANGEPVEIPMNIYNSVNAVDETAIKAKLDSSVVAGSYTFSISGIAAVSTRLWIGSTRKAITASNFAAYSLSIADNDLNSSGDTLIYLAYSATSGTTITPVTVTLTAKA